MKIKVILILIILLTLILRFYKLSDFRCLNWDEASFGYNAFSILKTGADEYGIRLPLQFKSVGDYKAPLYIYLMVPVINFFGLNEFSVRFIPSLLGSLSVMLVFFITRSLFKSEKIGVISAFLLAISPWHMQFTRAGADVAVSNFFVTFGILGMLLAVEGRKKWMYVSVFSFAMTEYSYFADRLFTPLIFSTLLAIYRKELLKSAKTIILSLLLGALIVLPLVPSLTSGGHEEKILKTTIFGYERPSDYIESVKTEDGGSDVLYYLFHTSVFENGWGAVNRYLNHFSPGFLFLEGVAKDQRQSIFKMGYLYLMDLPFLIIGVYELLRKKRKTAYFLLIWLLLAPLPSAITRDLSSARRSFNMLIPLIIIISLGYLKVWNFLLKQKSSVKYLITLLYIPVFTFFVGLYFLSYYVFTYNRTLKGPAGWSCGYKELVSSVNKVKGNYQKAVIDTSYQGPYIFFLFYENYPPDKYQRQAVLIQESRDSLGEGGGYDKYIFRPIYWPSDRCSENILFAGPPERLPLGDIEEGEARLVDRFYFINQEESFRLVESTKIDPEYCSTLKIMPQFVVKS